MRDLEEVGDRCAELFCDVDVSLLLLMVGWHVIVLIGMVHTFGGHLDGMCGLWRYARWRECNQWTERGCLGW